MDTQITHETLSSLVFDDKGLIPAIVQDARTGKVLMMAYMNQESLDITLKEQRTCFYSRSRQELWRKGETSGNTQALVSIVADCDRDSLLLSVIPSGPACHTGETSCFHNAIQPASQDDFSFSLEVLEQLIHQRKEDMTQGSYTTYLFTEGLDKILKKVGEETTEVVIGAKNRDKAELTYEVSDLVYHVLVLLAEQGVTVEEIRQELAKRHRE